MADSFPASLTFYVQTWDEYHTRTLTLGIVSGPVEGVLTLCIIYAFTAYIGDGNFWNHSMLETVGITKAAWIPDVVYNLSWTDSFIGYGGFILVLNTVWR